MVRFGAALVNRLPSRTLDLEPGHGETLRNVADATARTLTGAQIVVEYLVRRGVPFREAHEVVGHLVVWCQVHDCDLADVTDADLAKVSEYLTPDVRQVLTVDGALAARQGHGGTAPVRVAEQIAALRATVDAHAAWAAGDTR